MGKLNMLSIGKRRKSERSSGVVENEHAISSSITVILSPYFSKKVIDSAVIT